MHITGHKRKTAVVAVGLVAWLLVSAACGRQASTPSQVATSIDTGATPVADVTQPPPPTASTAPSATPTAMAVDVPTLEEVYARAAASLTQAGLVYHRTFTVEYVAEGNTLRGSIEEWIDAGRNVARTEVAAEVTEATPEVILETIAIIANEERTTRDPDGEFSVVRAPTCYGATEAVAAVLRCPGPTTESTTVVEHGEWEGRQAIVLVESGTTRGSDEKSTFVARLYLDAETYLPIIRISEGTRDTGEVVPERSRIIFEHEFIPADLLQPDFFDPASISHSPPNQNERLDRIGYDLTVFWLGERFEPGAGLPTLRLDSVTEPAHPDMDSYRGTLDYRASGNAVGFVMLTLWRRTDWEAEILETFEDGWSSRPCAHREELELAIGSAVIISSWDPGSTSNPRTMEPEGGCTLEANNVFNVAVYAGNTVIAISASNAASIRYGLEPNPYASQAGIVALVEGLRPR